MLSVAEIISQLNLAPLPEEGGFFRATWRAGITAQSSSASASAGSAGSSASAIYFLITDKDFSALHRLTLDEVWCHHRGDAAEQLQLDPRDNSSRIFTLGGDVTPHATPQLVVPAGVWQGTRLVSGGPHGWALFTCVVAPAWDQQAFALGQRAALTTQFPGERERIFALTR